MTNHRLAHFFLALTSITTVAACASSDVAEPDDAAPVVVSPVGHYDVRTSYVLAAPPPDAALVLTELDAATDGTDDPSRYLVDRLVARLPEGHTRDVAIVLSPYLAAYLQNRMDMIAPGFAPAIHEMSQGLDKIARRIDTVEELSVAADGSVRRSVNTLRFGAVAVDFSQIDPIETTATFSGDQLQLGSHAVRMPYGAVLRTGFDHAVLPAVVPGAYDLTTALEML